MSVELDIPQRPEQEEAEYETYRALSALAVVSLVVGLFSAAFFLSWVFVVLPVAGVLLATVAWRRVRSNPGLTGGWVALAGIFVSLTCLVGGATAHVVEFIYEVPEGYERVYFSQLQPEDNPAEEIWKLDGKKIFIKGYVLQGAISTNIKNFTMVRDSGSCCFGGTTPKQTDMIKVKMLNGLAIDQWSMKERKFAGAFYVRPQEATSKSSPIYHLDVEYVR